MASTAITQQIRFCAGHRLVGHQGKCRHLHGHEYVAEVVIQSSQLNDLGMVVDFADVKQLVKGWVDDNWDHNLLLDYDDPQRVHLEQTERRQPYIMPNGNPTAENMAAVLYATAVRLLPGHLVVVAVTIWETPNCRAEYRP